MKKPVLQKPANKPLGYRLLTGVDDRKFCERVSEALENGYELYGSPAATFNGSNVIVAQALILSKKNSVKKITNKKSKK
jgi:hypothetical protein